MASAIKPYGPVQRSTLDVLLYSILLYKRGVFHHIRYSPSELGNITPCLTLLRNIRRVRWFLFWSCCSVAIRCDRCDEIQTVLFFVTFVGFALDSALVFLSLRFGRVFRFGQATISFVIRPNFPPRIKSRWIRITSVGYSHYIRTANGE